uniref:Phthiocerol/phthiodiolone dimycocerosyl transferase C-terminal domain-containing protein n=1 Tax=Aegilops tauschii subsp. strangulata TaxID=200361 RepID=A0A453FZJ1_AEGTS
MDSGTGEAAWRSRAVCGTEYSWCRAAPGGTGATLIALRLSRGGAAAEAAVRALQSAHPVLRAHLRGPASSPTLAFPSSAPQLRLAPQPCALDFHSLLEREINRNPWAAAAPGPDGAPVLFAALYELPPPAGGAALFVLIHTAVCDRAASEALPRELLALLGGAGVGGPEVKEETAAVEAGLEKRMRKKDSRKPLWARGVDMVGYSIDGLRASTLPFEETGTARSTQMVRLRFSREDTTRLLHACKENGVGLCSAMAAATMLAARQSKKLSNSGQQETYSVATLINCCEFLEPPLNDLTTRFFYSAITNTHKINGEEGLWVLARRCHDAYSNAKKNKKHLTDIRDLNFLMCRAIENPRLTTASALRTALVSVFEELATLDVSDMQSKAGVKDYICCATMHDIGPSIGVFDSIKDGELDWACMHPSPLHSRKQIQEVLDKVKMILHEGSNPSDDKNE